MRREVFNLWLERWVDRLTGLEALQLALLAFTLGSLGLGLGVVAVRLSLGFMLLVALISVSAAWTLARARLSAWGYGLVGVLLGGIGMALTVGQLAGPLGALAASLPALAESLLQREFDPSATVAAWQSLTGTLFSLAARFEHWFRGVGAQTPVIDPTVTSILWGLALWLGAFWAAWWVRRRDFTLMGLLPLAALLGYNVFYTRSSIGLTWLGAALAGMLLLQAGVEYGVARRRWCARRLEQEQVEGRLVFLAVALTVGVLLAGSLLPSVPVRKIADLVESAFQPRGDPSLARSLGLEATPDGDGPGAPATLPATGVQLSPRHALGPGPMLDSRLVMFVAVDGYQPPPDEYSQAAVHYYWRAQAYDVYDGRGWSVTSARVDELAANQPTRAGVDLSSLAPGQGLVSQRVTRLRPGDSAVFAAGELLRLDQPATVTRRADGELISAQAAGSYAALSRVQSPHVEQLRAAATNYPAALRPYLELPDELPARVFDLALNLTVDQPTPYDRAAVLEAYLRQFPYSREVPAPPEGRDAVDYFLFDLKTGYCDYYASALVVMARAAGLPARLVLGYTQGVYDPLRGHFVVRAAQAHAWVEVYFPDIGWVEFEPTPSQPLPARPGQPGDSRPTVSLPPPGQEAPLSLHLERTRLGRLILAVLVFAVCVSFIPFLPLETWWLTLLPVERVFEIIFRRLYRRGRAFGLPPTPARTPNDFARALSSMLDGQRTPLAAALCADLGFLTRLYNRLLFSEHPPREEDKRAAILAWARLRRGLRQI